MTITNIELLAKLVGTAKATYGELAIGSLKQTLIETADFTLTEAQAFVDRYELIHQQPNTLNGFSAAVFQDKQTGRLVLAIRGTEPLAGGFVDLLSADFVDIGLTGFANHQAFELYRYWRKLTTTGGQDVDYSDTEIEALYALNNGSVLDGLNANNHALAISHLKAQLDVDKGLLANKIPADMKVDVTGHSLGGNLAYVFSRMFPQNTAQVVTLNAPGLGGDGLLNSLGFIGAANTTSVRMEGDLVHNFGGSHYGGVINVSQEVGHDTFSGIGSNHSSINGVDGLNILKLFATVDPSEANRPGGILNEFMRASSNKALDTYENMLDGLRKILLGGGSGFKETPDATTAESDVEKRETYYKNIDDLNTALTNGHLKYLVGNVSLVKAAENSSHAQTDYGQFLSLYFLTPFALSGNELDLKKLNPDVYALWVADQELDAEDHNNGTANFSDIWYEDRAAALAALIARNTDDSDFDTTTNDTHYVSYRDANGNELVTSEPLSWMFKPFEIIGFGDDTANNLLGYENNDRLYGGKGVDNLSGKEGHDYLEGGAGNDLLYGGDGTDQLYGGADDDQLVGEGGNDLLFGGEGDDTYSFTGQFGRDMIKDSDNQGSIEFNSTKLSQLTQSAKDSIIYYDDINNPTKKAVLIDEGNTKSLIISTVTKNGNAIIDSGNSVTIKDWNGSNLGLALNTSTPVAEADLKSVTGNTEANALYPKRGQYTTVNDLVMDGNYDAALIHGGDGNDYIAGSYGSDHLYGDKGNDWISAEAGHSIIPESPLPSVRGKDTIEGGEGNDVITGRAQGSEWHGGAGRDMLISSTVMNISEAAALTSALWTNNNVGSIDSIAWKDLQNLLKADYKSYAEVTSESITHSFSAWAGIEPGSYSGASSIGSGWSYELTLNSNKKLHDAAETKGIGVSLYGHFMGTDLANPSGTFSFSNPTVNGGAKSYLGIALQMQQIALPTGKTLADIANDAYGQLFGDDGDDLLVGWYGKDELLGGKDNDALWGNYGNDILDGGEGNDTLSGEWGDDTLIGGAGNDLLMGDDFNAAPTSDNDVLYGGQGDDTLDGSIGNDYLDGGTGADQLSGDAGNDYLYAGNDQVKDTLSGGIGNDTLVAGSEFDLLMGDGGDDIYILSTHKVQRVINGVALASAPEANGPNNSLAFTASDIGNDAPAFNANSISIIDSEGSNTLAVVGQGDFDNVGVVGFGDNLVLTFANNTQVTVMGGSNNAVNIISVDSEDAVSSNPITTTALTDDELLKGGNLLTQTSLDTTRLTLSNMHSAVTLTAANSNAYLAGGLVDDTLTAHIDGSKLVGGRGDDVMNGELGDDQYLIRNDDGHDIITEKGGNNTIKLGKGIASNQLTAHRSGADFLITLSSTQIITVKNMFNASTGELVAANSIQQIQFYDGAVLTLAQLQQLAITGTAADDIIGTYNTADTLIGGLGNDQLTGGAGDDVYKYALGDGNDVITDTSGNDVLELGSGILQSQVTALRDGYNNLVLRFSNGGSISVAGAFDTLGNFTANAIETIKFADNSTWNLTQLNIEVAKETVLSINGSLNDESLTGSTGKDILNAGKGNDSIGGSVGDDAYQYALGDGKDIVIDKGGLDRIEFASGILQSDVFARSNGNDLVLTLSDSGSITVKNMFAAVSQTPIDPLITNIIHDLQTTWMPQAEKLIEEFYGLTGSGDFTLQFGRGVQGGEAARVGYTPNGDGVRASNIVLEIDLDDFGNASAKGPLYNDRVIAHEMVHAVMARNMNMTNLPGWLTEGAAEFIHGADERVLVDWQFINSQNNFNAYFKTSVGSPSTTAGYSVSYLTVKILDAEIRNYGGAGIKDLFAELKAGKTLDQALSAVSVAYGGMGGKWNNLATFEAHVQASGFSISENLLNLNNADTGSIAGSDNGNPALDPYGVISGQALSTPSHFNVIIPDIYRQDGSIENTIEAIKFSDSSTWDIARIQQEILKGTQTGTVNNDTLTGTLVSDTLIGGKGNDKLNGEKGHDVYKYELGDGNDEITDASGIDRIEFGAGISQGQVSISTLNANDIELNVAGNSITIRNGLNFADELNPYAIDHIKFSNGVIWNLDTIFPGPIKGTIGNDTLNGFDTNDILVGGKGDDTIAGGKGNDVYRYSLGDGDDTITDVAGIDVIEFGVGIFQNEITVEKDAFNNLIITPSDNAIITVLNAFDAQGNFTTNAIESIKFYGNYVWNQTKIKQMLNAPAKTLVGTVGIDVLNGDTGNDTLAGGQGDDQLNGLRGNDIYKYALGDGNDVITDAGGWLDVIELGAGINEDDIKLERRWNAPPNSGYGHLYIVLENGNFITIKGMFDDQGYLSLNKIESIRFNNGVIWDSSRIALELLRGTSGNDQIRGFSSDDVFVGGKGNDVFNGHSGNDIYRFASGDGQDNIYEGVLGYLYGDSTVEAGYDVIEFDSSITPASVSVRNQDGNLVFILPSEQRVTVANMFDRATGAVVSYKAIELIKFADGSQWDTARILQEILKATDKNDIVFGSDADDFITGGQGSDTLVGNAGNDSLLGGTGDDSLMGGLGNDTLVGGSGIDYLDGGSGDDVYQYKLGDGSDIITDASGNNRIVLGENISEGDFFLSGNNFELSMEFYSGKTIQISSSSNASFSIQFFNGNVWSADTIAQKLAVSNSSPDTIIGDDGNNLLQGNYNGNQLSGGVGNDSLYGAIGDDTLSGDAGNDFLSGGEGRDNLSGGIGDDTLVSGLGYDTLDGGDGNDKFYIGQFGFISGGLGDDHYYVDDESKYVEIYGDAGGADELHFGSGTLSSDVIVRTNGDNTLQFFFRDNETTQANVRLSDQFTAGKNLTPNKAIENFSFADGTVWTLEDARLKSLIGTHQSDTIYGFDVDDVITGNKGDDHLVGGMGNDTYQYSLGDGNDFISDGNGDNKIQFGNGIAVGQLSYGKNSNNQATIFIRSADGSDVVGSISVSNPQRLKTIVFSDDSTFDLTSSWQSLSYDMTPPNLSNVAFDTTGKIITGITEPYSVIFAFNSVGADLNQTWTTADASGAFTYYLTKALINSEQVTVSSVDSAGNTTILNIVAPDKTAPVLSSAAFDTTYGFVKGSAEAGSTITIKKGSVVLATGVTDANGLYNVALSAPLINKEVITISAADAAGNVSTTKTLTAPDKTPPGIPTAAFDTTGKVITGIAEAGSTVIVKNSTNTTTLKSVTAHATTGAYTITLTTALINKETVNVTAKDAAGNVSAVKAIIAPDKTAPSLPTAAFDAAGKVITGVAEAGSTVTVKNSGNTTTLGTATANATTGAYTITLTTALINKETVNVTAKDAAGNVSAVKAIIAPDKTAPALPTAAFDAAGKVITGVAEAGSTVTVKNSGNTTTLGTATANATTGAYSITLTTALINKEIVNVTAKDSAGNVSAIKAIIAPDKTAPALPTAAFDTVGKVITGIAEAGSTVEVKNSGNTATLGTATANATTGAYSVTLATALTNGQTVNVTAKDVAGNVSAAKAIIAPKLAAALASQSFMSQKSVDPTHQLDSLIQAMAAFAPPSASESKVLVGVYDMTQPILASQA